MNKYFVFIIFFMYSCSSVCDDRKEIKTEVILEGPVETEFDIIDTNNQYAMAA